MKSIFNRQQDWKIISIPKTVVIETIILHAEIQRKMGGIRWYFVPKLVPKSKYHFPYVIGKNRRFLEKLRVWLRSRQY